MEDLFKYGPGNFREFIRTNYVAILYTVIIHLVILIILVLVKVDGLKKDKELGVMLDFSKEISLEDMLKDEQSDLPPEWIEHIYEARANASNRAVNLNDEVNQEISTEDYVNELLNELEAEKDEEFLKDREKWKDIISSYVHEEDAGEVQIPDSEEEPFTGPTTITYEFRSEPKNRQKRHLTVPVYKCEGSALVKVDIEVRRDGSVGNVTVVSVESGGMSTCFVEAAEKAALSSSFYSDYNAPEKHVARITYQFVAQ
ncbi:MAG: hypothetical protein WD052_06425 [Bacteroidales bacterium]